MVLLGGKVALFALVVEGLGTSNLFGEFWGFFFDLGLGCAGESLVEGSSGVFGDDSG